MTISLIKLTLLGLLASTIISFNVKALDVVELKLPSSNKVVIKFMFKNGSIADPVGKEGLTYTTANLLTASGTGKLSFSDIQQLAYPMSASYGVTTDKEVSVVSFSVHQDFLTDFYPVIKGLITAPSFAEKDFKRLIDSQQNYVDQVVRSSSDEDYSKLALEHLLFRGTNYQHLKQGTSASVKLITLDDVKDHYKKVFTQHNLTIGIAGNYSAKFLTTLKNDMQGLSNAKVVIADAGIARTPKGIQVEVIEKKSAFGSAIFTGFPLAITKKDDDFAALMVANSWLGEHRKSYSRLYQKIRQERSMNYGDYSYIEWYERSGRRMTPFAGTPRSSNYMALWIRPVQIAKQLKNQYVELNEIKVGHAHFALRMAIRELDLMIKKGMSQEEFATTRDFLKSYTKLFAQTPNHRIGYLLDSTYYGREDYLAEIDILLAELTLEDVNKAIKKYWQVDNMFVTIITDKSEAQPLADSLLNNTVSPMSYSNVVKKGLSAETLAEDDIVASYPLNIKSVVIVKSEDTFK